MFRRSGRRFADENMRQEQAGAGAVLLGRCSPLLGPLLRPAETVTFAAGIRWRARRPSGIDPWPAAAYNRNIAYNGPRVAGAIERYRTGKIIEPKGTGTSSSYTGGAPQSGQGGGAANSAGAGSAAPQ